jgi:hypothetical protein
MEPSERSTTFRRPDGHTSGAERCASAGGGCFRFRPLASVRYRPHASLMKRNGKLWALVAVLFTGLWAGAAAAQNDEGWFEGEQPERPTLRIEGKGQYDPPPPDFQSQPSGEYSAPVDEGDDEDPATDESTDPDGPDEQQRGEREFSPHLAPYGYWVSDPVYGRVWVPQRRIVGEGFAPYSTAGHWELTPEDEWLWVSDYPFGWVTFHYGRWVWASGGVWGWVPGYTYAPAWVDFRIGAGGYIGWGPLAPYSVWRNGLFVSIGGYHRHRPYVYCPTNYVFSRSVHRYVVRDRYRARSIAAQTYRYRPSYASQVRVRYPSPYEARIPSRAIPSQRVVARPRLSTPRVLASEARFRRADNASVSRSATRSSNFRRGDGGFSGEARSRRDIGREQSFDRSRSMNTRERSVGPRDRDGGPRERGVNPRSVNPNRASPSDRGSPRGGWSAPGGNVRRQNDAWGARQNSWGTRPRTDSRNMPPSRGVQPRAVQPRTAPSTYRGAPSRTPYPAAPAGTQGYRAAPREDRSPRAVPSDRGRGDGGRSSRGATGGGGSHSSAPRARGHESRGYSR